MGLSVWQIAVVGILVVLLFGRGKISDLMGDVAKGIKSFKKGIKEDVEDGEEVATTIDHEPAATVNATETEKSQAS